MLLEMMNVFCVVCLELVEKRAASFSSEDRLNLSANLPHNMENTALSRGGGGARTGARARAGAGE